MLVIGLLFGANTYAQNKPFACQQDEAVGLNWEKDRWKMARFRTMNFILIVQNGNLTVSSVAKAFGGHEAATSCRTAGYITCSDIFGSNMIYDPQTMKGAISTLLGGTEVGENRDSVLVRVFTCQPF